MGIEYELKFQADTAALTAIAAEYACYGQTHYDMETTYYDTPSGALSARHYTLRRRMENQQSVCTLKTPALNYGRNEIELPCSSIEDAIPLMCAGGAPEDFKTLTDEGILPVCGAKFHRIAILLEQAGCCVELALDSGILTGGEKTIPLCEVEVELKSGNPLAADLFALELAQKYGLETQTRSKFRRALALYRGEL